MDYLLDKDHWRSLVLDFKDSERQYDIPADKSKQLALDILETVRRLSKNKIQLFKEHRGEEYEMMVKKLNSLYDEGAVRRLLNEDEFWDATFRLR
jgi:hypothetical protein